MYKTKAQNMDRRIHEKAVLIPNNYIRNAMSSFHNRITHCQTMNGEQFEQLL